MRVKPDVEMDDEREADGPITFVKRKACKTGGKSSAKQQVLGCGLDNIMLVEKA